MAGRRKAGEEVLRYELPGPLRRADEDGKWTWRRAGVWQLVSVLNVRLPASTFLPFPSPPSHSPVACRPVFFPLLPLSLPFLAHLPYLLTITHCSPSLVTKTFSASVSSSVKWAYILLPCRVEGLSEDNAGKCFVNLSCCTNVTHHHYYFSLEVLM